MSSSRKFQISAFLILLFHTVGLIGMNVGPYAPLFEGVAWANILLSLALLMWCDEFYFSQKRESAKGFFSQRRESAKEINTSPKSTEGKYPSRRTNVFKPPLRCLGVFVFAFISFVLGLFAEVIGVKTGLIFGAYHYTSVFGWSLLSVPIIIGVNWVLLTYAAGVSVSRFSISPVMKVIIAAALMTACDMLLEGFAIKHHFWVWDSGLPPARNFIGWFAVSLILQGFYQLLIPQSRNRLAVFYLLVFVVFLMVDRVL